MSIRYFYDTVSPYAFLGYETLSKYTKIWNIEVDYVPFLLGGVMKLSENTPPSLNKKRLDYLRLDIARNARFIGVEIINSPTVFPLNTTSIQRVLTVIKATHPALQQRSMESFWKSYWQRNTDITTPAELRKCLSFFPDDAFNAIIASSTTEAIKQKLKQETAYAVDKGAFGAPFIIVTNAGGKEDVFFGSDRFEQIAKHLGKPWLGYTPIASAKL